MAKRHRWHGLERQRPLVSLIVVEFICDEHGRFDGIYPRSDIPDTELCPECGTPSSYAISAPGLRFARFEVQRGGVAEKPNPYAMDTRPLADGMTQAEWKAQRRKLRQDQRRQEIKKILG